MATVSLPATVTAATMLLLPVLALVWSTVLLNESIRPIKIGGATVVILGVACAQRAVLGRQTERVTPVAGPAPNRSRSRSHWFCSRNERNVSNPSGTSTDVGSVPGHLLRSLSPRPVASSSKGRT